MKKIVSFFIRRPKVTNLILVLVVLAGIIAIKDVRKQDFPTVDFDIMKITTTYPGAGPEDVEINVTDPIEDELENVEDIDEIKSLSMENLSLILVYINPDAKDLRKTKSDVRDAVDRVTDFPEEVTDKPKVEEIRSTDQPVIEVAIYGDAQEKELRQFAKDLETELKTIEGVGIIEKVGYRKREIHIEADSTELIDKYVSLGEIMNSIRSRNVRTSGGSLESFVTEKNIVTFAEYNDPMEVKDVIIRSTFTGNRLRISDVAVVKDGFEERNIIARSNGNRSIAVIVKRQENADIIKISDEIKKRLDNFKKTLPKNIHAGIMYDNSIYTKSMLNMVFLNGIVGFALVLIVMFLFLDWKSAFWTAFGIPISMCGAFILFEPFGITMNVITLSAIILILGMLVDDAIVIAENTYRLKEEGMPPIEGTIEGVSSVFKPVLAAVLTTMFAFIPIFFMEGITGKFITGIATVVILMLGFSLIESTCFLPCHIAHASPPKKTPKRTRWIPHAINKYEKIITWCLRRRYRLIISFVALLVVVVTIGSIWIKFILFPQNNPDVFNVVVEAPKATTLMATEQKVAEVEAVIDKTIPSEVMQNYITRIGHHDTDVYGGTAGQYSNWALITIYLVPADDRKKHRSEEIMDELQERLNRLSGFDRLTVEGVDDGPPVGKPITVIYISDSDKLRNRFEEETLNYLKKIKGVSAVETNNLPGKDELRLKLNYDTMPRLNITALDVAQTVRAAFEGEVVTSIRKTGEEIDFRVSLKDPKKFRDQDVLELLVSNKDGKLIPLKNFAYFEDTKGPATIHHYDGKRAVTITAEVDSKSITAIEANQLLRKKFESEVRKHPGLRIEFGGEEKKTQESMQSFYAALFLAVIAIYFLLVILFNSYSQPILIMSAIPFAIIGVFITFLLHGLPLGFVAMIGILGLAGVVVNDSIVMVSHLNEMCETGGKTFSSVIKGAAKRFRPVILTTLTTVAGLLPTAYGIGGDIPFIRPMVLAMAWGLTFATLVTLIFTPLLYSVHARIKT
jgi:multidrug efflux pump subunit AcrB